MQDDRRAFLDEQRDKALKMAADADIRQLDLELTAASDRYDYSYMWTWLGAPIIQMPTDIVVMQELIWRHQPDVVVETGVARGGSVLLYASILELLGRGRVVAVDIEIRAHNRDTITAHPLANRISLVEGSSVADEVLEKVRSHISAGDRVMVVLDSDHTHEHVLAELRAYAPLVSPGMPLVVADTMVEELPAQTHRKRPWGPGANPHTAVEAFLSDHADFVRDEEVIHKLLMTSSRTGYLRRR